MGTVELAKRYKVAEAIAAKFVATFHRAFPAVKQWTAHVKRQCHDQGFVTTITQRRRLVVRTDDRDSAAKARLERQAVNSVVQGSASDIMKLAMIAIHKTLDTNQETTPVLPPSNQPRPPPPRMILQVHDELIFEVAAQARVIAQLVADMRQCMEVHVVASLRLKVPLAVTTMVGPSWGNMRPFVGPAGPTASPAVASGGALQPQVRQSSSMQTSSCPLHNSSQPKQTPSQQQQQQLSVGPLHRTAAPAPKSSPFFVSSNPHGSTGLDSVQRPQVPFSQ